MSKRYGITIIVLVQSIFISACNSGVDAIRTIPINPNETPTARATETYTAPTSKPETSTPTEAPLFTEAEIEKADPFDASENLDSWPDRFRQTELYPENATDQEWSELQIFIEAMRENKGIMKTAEYVKFINSGLQSLWNGLRFKTEHPEMGAIIVSPREMRTMVEEKNKIILWWDNIEGKTYGYGFDKSVELFSSPTIFYSSEVLDIPILGREDVNAGRIPFDSASGIDRGRGRVGKNEIIMTDMRGTDGYHSLLGAAIFKEGFIFPKGTVCENLDGRYDPRLELPGDVNLPSLRGFRGSSVDWATLDADFGNMISIKTYNLEVEYDIPGYSGPSPECFSPGLNLEMAGALTINKYKGISAPWTEK